MDDVLKQCRLNFGPALRTFSRTDRYLRTAKPWWCILRPDALNTFFKNRETLLREGVIVWSHIVQANTILFQPGSQNAPGEVIFGTDPDEEMLVPELATIARRLYSFKGAKGLSPEEQRLGDHLAAETSRALGFSVPSSVSGSKSCALTTVYFDRKHLPAGRLCRPYFPLLVLPREPRVAMPLPVRFWPASLVSLWQNRV